MKRIWLGLLLGVLMPVCLVGCTREADKGINKGADLPKAPPAKS